MAKDTMSMGGIMSFCLATFDVPKILWHMGLLIGGE